MLKIRTDQMYTRALNAGAVHSILEVSQRGGGSYPTVHRMATGTPDGRINLDALENFLILGLRMDPAELARMPLGDLFEFEEPELVND